MENFRGIKHSLASHLDIEYFPLDENLLPFLFPLENFHERRTHSRNILIDKVMRFHFKFLFDSKGNFNSLQSCQRVL